MRTYNVVRQNAVHVARMEKGQINIYEKGVELETRCIMPIRLRTNVTEEDVFNFFEMSDENNRIMLMDFCGEVSE